MSVDGLTTSTTVKQPLDDIMLAMDVVDTLRRRERLVKKELDEEGRHEDLKERLRKIYAAQGIEVPDHVIDQGVAALKEERFTYKPPPDTFSTRLARIYVKRNKWGKWLLGGIAVSAIAGLINYFTITLPNAGLPDELKSLHNEVVQMAKSDNARLTADRYLAAGQSALGSDNTDRAKATVTELQSLRTSLQQEYTIRIVNRQGVKSGVWRIPDINTSAKNYYLIVEAIDPSGNTLSTNILNEETGMNSTVDTWGLRVDKNVFDRVARDKRDDGIIENDRMGYKERGYLIPKYEMKTSGGAITRW